MNALNMIIFFSGIFSNNDTTLTVVVSNIEVGKGTVVVSIWNDPDLFLKKPMLSKSMKADSTSLEFSFPLAGGTYAISVYQDINENQKLDLGMFNKPKEPVGFGNNFRPKFSAPKFEDCAISLTESMKIEIELK